MHINAFGNAKNVMVGRKYITISVCAPKIAQVYLEHLQGDCVLLKFWMQELQIQIVIWGCAKIGQLTTKAIMTHHTMFHKQ